MNYHQSKKKFWFSGIAAASAKCAFFKSFDSIFYDTVLVDFSNLLQNFQDN